MCVWSIFHVLSNKRHKKSLCVSIFIMSGSHAIYYPRHFISQNILGIFSYIAHYPAISVKVQTVCPFWDFRLSRTSFIFQYYQYAYVLMGVWSECLSRVYKDIFHPRFFISNKHNWSVLWINHDDNLHSSIITHHQDLFFSNYITHCEQNFKAVKNVKF